MSVLDSPLTAARIAAWHNRHPLARRISAAEVTGFGVVALPFAAESGVGRREPALAQEAPSEPTGTTLRQRAQAADVHEPSSGPVRASAVAVRARAFDEDFLPGVTPRRAAVFGARFGVDEDPSRGTLPRRDLVVNRRGDVAIRWRYVWSAAIESHGKRVRILFSGPAADQFRVTGPRMWAPSRLVLIALLPLLAVTSLGVARQMLSRPGEPVVAVAPVQPPNSSAQATSSASSIAGVEESTSRSTREVPIESPAAASSLPMERAAEARTPDAAASAAPVPPSGLPPGGQEPEGGQRLVINLRPRLDPEMARRARLESAAARAGGAHGPTPGHSTPSSAMAQHAGEHVYAVVARATRTRAASQVMLGLMQATVAGEGVPGARADVLPSEQGYRASWWPFRRRADAEMARDRLAKLGVPVDVVEF